MENGFTLINEEELKEISSDAQLYRHNTGAELIYIKNDDKNKVFGIMFKTLPENNTGVFHVLEHCVLCGSRKYPMKDPFGELSKGTLHTYLNAMTFRDKTMYPVAGVNEKDFFKMTDVYLNAVFFPLVLDKKEIMLQEGVNYRLDNEGNVTGYGGIVFNEMSGSFSETDEYLKHAAYERLFNNSSYMYDSGGLPKEIPSLTYDYLLSCHNRFYSPENAYFYLYGDLDIDKYLNHIDSQYLSQCGKGGTRVKTEEIFLPENPQSFELTGKTGKSYGLTSVLSRDINTPRLITGLSVLCHYLFRSSASPVKRLVTEEKLGDEISDFFDFHLPNPVINISVKNCASMENVKEKIFNTIKDITDNGFDNELLDSIFQTMEFNLREESYGTRPKGLHYLILASTSWLYGRDPFEPLKRREILNGIKNDKDYLTALLKQFFLNNSSIVTGYASGEEKAKEFDSYKANPQITAENKSLEEYRGIKEDDNVLSIIPTLPLSEIEKKSDFVPIEVDNSLRVSCVRLNTNGITHFYFMFDLSGVSEIKNLYLLTYLLGKLDTKNYRFFELTTKINANLGRIGFSSHCFASYKSDGFKPKLIVDVSVLNENIDKAFEYTKEIILNTLFTDEDRIRSLILEYKSRLYSHILSSGHSWAVTYAQASLRPAGLYYEKIAGITFYKYLFEINNISALCEDLKKLALSVFNKDNFSIHFTSDSDFAEKFIPDFIESLPLNNTTNSRFSETQYYGSTRFLTDAGVNFNGLVLDYKANGYEYNGSLNVLSNILNNQYLMQKIRLEGGAYGFGCSFGNDGLARLYSYRDPNIDNTYDVFKSIREFVENISLTERQMTQYIIGAINPIDTPKLPSTKGGIALTGYLCGQTEEDVQRERDEILETTPKILKSYSPMLELKAGTYDICSFGKSSEKSALFNHEYKIT